MSEQANLALPLANPYLSNWPTLYKKNHKFFAGVHRQSKIKDIDQSFPHRLGYETSGNARSHPFRYICPHPI